MLKFFRRGATFIQGGTSIPESRVGTLIDKQPIVLLSRYLYFAIQAYKGTHFSFTNICVQNNHKHLQNNSVARNSKQTCNTTSK